MGAALFQGNIGSIGQAEGYSDLCKNAYADYTCLELKLSPKNLIDNKRKQSFEKPLSLILEREEDKEYICRHSIVELEIKDPIAAQSIYNTLWKCAENSKWRYNKRNSRKYKRNPVNYFRLQEDIDHLLSRLTKAFEADNESQALNLLNETHVASIQYGAKNIAAYCEVNDDKLALVLAEKSYKKPRLRINFKCDKTGKLMETKAQFFIAGLNWYDTLNEIVANIFKSDYVSVETKEYAKTNCSDNLGSIQNILMELCKRVDENGMIQEKQTPNLLYRGVIDNIEQIPIYFSLADRRYNLNDCIGLNLSSRNGEINLLLEKIWLDEKERQSAKFHVTYAYYNEQVEFSESELSQGAEFVYRQMKKILMEDKETKKATLVTLKAIRKTEPELEKRLGIINVPLMRTEDDVQQIGIDLDVFCLNLIRVYMTDTRIDLKPTKNVHPDVKKLINGAKEEEKD